MAHRFSTKIIQIFYFLTTISFLLAQNSYKLRVLTTQNNTNNNSSSSSSNTEPSNTNNTNPVKDELVVPMYVSKLTKEEREEYNVI